ncbi:phage tail length tape measure family protein [Methylobacterium indicum]|uniref:Bacteriophage tail tape measure N-terminal domain-containing protein n=1 Tax=Methylobacterium indicum TaxID=1775910 RepID=A0A8H8X0X6_9HYPH|nr:phage tail length tape measure family protein [Methylobacterium indicum]BCM88095.1 hypothetical protein mvi_65560 [Methylobacterium indicum]
MTADLAALSFAVDSDPIKRAVSTLDDLVAASVRAEQGVARLGASGSTAARLATDIAKTGQAAGESAQTVDRLRDALGRFTSSAGTVSRVADGFKAGTQAAREFEAAAKRANQAAADAANQPRTPSLIDPPSPSNLPTPRNDNRRGLDTRDKLFIQYQAFDTASQLGSGASPLTVGLQQGTQVIQQLADREGGLKAGLKDVGASLLGLVTPTNVAIGAVGAVAAAVAVAAVQVSNDAKVFDKATQGIGRVNGNTASQLDNYARANAEAGKVSTSTAREIVAALAETGQVSDQVYGTIIQKASDYAKITGQDVSSATAELASMFANAGDGADAMAQKIGGLDDRTRQLIQTQIEQGDKTAAQTTLAEALKATIDANAAATTGWAAAWNTATAAADRYWEAAKRAVGIKLGVITESGQDALGRTQETLDNTNRTRAAIGLGPLRTGDRLVRERDTAAVIADQERRIAEGKAAEERADRASVTAGNIARAVDPNFAKLSTLRKQQSDLRDALADPLARSKISDLGQTEDAYTATTRAITSMTDATGKMVSVEEMARRQDQLRIDAINAKTDAEKASVAERQKAFELIGQTITPSDARGRVERAGTISRLESAKSGSGGGGSEALDDYDRAIKRAEDQTRKTQEQIASFGLGAGAAARYRTEQELLVAAKRSDREVTPELTRQIQEYADKAGEAATKLEAVRQASQQSFALQNFAGNSIVNVLDQIGSKGTTAASIISGLADSFKKAALQSVVMGTGPFAGLFGTGAAPGSGMAGGLVGSLFGALKGGNALQGPTATGATLDAAAGSSIFSAIGTGIRSLFGFAKGGSISGPGTSTSDSILARLSAGEFVVNAKSAQRHRGLLDQINGAGIPGYSEGGALNRYGLAMAGPPGAICGTPQGCEEMLA